MATNTHSGKFICDAHERASRLRIARRHHDPQTGIIEECRMAHEWLDPVRLADERNFKDACWFGYGFLRPYERNELFARAYNESVKAHWQVHHLQGGGSPAQCDWEPVHPVFEQNSPEIMSAIHHARQHFDALGLPYEAAIGCVIREGIRLHGPHGIPRPNQLYCNLAIEALVEAKDRLLENLSPILDSESDDRFLACNYAGHPSQEAALVALHANVLQAFRPTNRLGHYLTTGFISESEARSRFEGWLVDEAVAGHGPARFTTNGSSEGGMPQRPSCMGYAYDITSSICKVCPVVAACGAEAKQVIAAQIEVTGTDNPRKQRDRVGARHRKRKERLRKKPEAIALAAARRVELRQIRPDLFPEV